MGPFGQDSCAYTRIYVVSSLALRGWDEGGSVYYVTLGIGAIGS